jgi:hypothetical protein
VGAGSAGAGGGALRDARRAASKVRNSSKDVSPAGGGGRLIHVSNVPCCMFVYAKTPRPCMVPLTAHGLEACFGAA